MIILKKLKWSNAFSYGKNNEIDFSTNDLVQLIGKNGHGKSSIALILEEVLYNKNSKGIKKADIINRNTNDTSYTIELNFSKDNVDYIIKTVRGNTQTVKLLCGAEDISAHTSTNTYKLIEDIIGIDHKTFTQIVYQSSSASLEFLTATDTNRKKFLIDLLNLNIYNKASDIFKGLLKNAVAESEVITLKVNNVKSWLDKYTKEDLTIKELLHEPLSPIELNKELANTEYQITNIDKLNKKISQNNIYKEIIKTLDITVIEVPKEDRKPIETKISSIKERISKLDSIIKGTGPIKNTCDVCGQPIDNSHKLVMKKEAEEERKQLIEEWQTLLNKLVILNAEYAKYDKYFHNKEEWEKYYQLIDTSLEHNTFDKAELSAKASSIAKTIKTINDSILSIQKQNSLISAHNAKVDVIKTQLDSMQKDLSKLEYQDNEAKDRVNILQILNKTFSTSGLVAYKIECLVKDLEDITNEYLLDMSDGRFQLAFKINSSDKLNVIITDNGRDIDILALSNGERSRVNVSTLLAIRKLMQSLSNSRINLLILDETVESLDTEGKERLIEVLLKEEHLNTLLISHGFTHPLLEKISVVKDNNISRIE